MTELATRRGAALACALVALTAGCGAILGLDDFTDQEGGGAAGATGGAGNSGAAGGATGGGGQGAGGGTGGGSTCEPNTTQDCYTGPAGTEDVGLCQGGTETCAADGSGFGACEGEVTPVVESCSASTDENCDGLDCTVWASFITGPAGLEPFAVQGDSQGNVIATGFFTQSVTIAGTSYPAVQSTDIFLVKYSPTGEVLWADTFGDAFEDVFVRMVIAPNDDIILVGRTNSPVDFGGGPTPAGLVVVRLNPMGEEIWTRSCGSDGALTGVDLDGAGNILVAGFSDSAINCGTGVQPYAGGDDIVVIKLDGATGSATAPNGWVRTFGSAGNDLAWDVEVDSTGAAYVTGAFSGNLDFGGFGGAVINQGGRDAFLVKVSSSGSTVFTRTIGAAGNQDGFAVGTTADGRSVFGGRFAGTITVNGVNHTSVSGSDGFLVSYAPGGAFGWSRIMPHVYLNDLEIDGQDRIAITGALTGVADLGGAPITPIGAVDMFVAKLDDTGSHLWNRRFDGGVGGDVFGVGIGKGAADETLVMGLFDDPVDFGTGAQSPGSGVVVLSMGE